MFGLPGRVGLLGTMPKQSGVSAEALVSALVLAGAGAIYTPSDLTSLYQSRTGDSTGATGQPVGIMLDKSNMGGQTAAAYIAGRPELLGASTVSTAIPAKTTWDGSTRRLTIVGAASGEAAATTLTTLQTVVGKTYCLTANVSSIAGDSFTFLINGGNAGQLTGTGVKTVVWTANSVTHLVRLIEWAGTLTDIDVTFSVKEIPGFHALAPSDAARPTLTVAGSLAYLTADGVDDWMNVTPTLNLGEAWWHVGGWRSDTAGRAAFATSNGFRTAMWNKNSRWEYHNTGDTATEQICTGNPNAISVLTAEKTALTAMSGRFNGGGSLTIGAYDGTAATKGLVLFSQGNASWASGFGGRFYGGAFVPGTITGPDRSIVEAYIAVLAGVTL